MLTGSKRTAGIAFAVLLVGVIVLVAATSRDRQARPAERRRGRVRRGGAGRRDHAGAVRRGARAGRRAPAGPGGARAGDPAVRPLAGDGDGRPAALALGRRRGGRARDRGHGPRDRRGARDDHQRPVRRPEGVREVPRAVEVHADEDARERVRLQLLSQRIQEDVLGTEPPDIPDEEVAGLLRGEHRAVPDARDARRPDAAEPGRGQGPGGVRSALRGRLAGELEAGDEEALDRRGDLRRSAACARASSQGQNEPAARRGDLQREEGELVGPIETEAGFYVLQVDAITPASTQPLDDQTKRADRADAGEPGAAGDRRRLPGGLPRASGGRAPSAPTTSRSTAAATLRPPPDACAGDDEGEEPGVDPATGEPIEGCPAPVPSTQPVPPSSAGDSAATGLPQGPQGLAPPAPAVPPGTQTIPGAPPGTAPPGTAPPGTAPPGTAPPEGG